MQIGKLHIHAQMNNPDDKHALLGIEFTQWYCESCDNYFPVCAIGFGIGTVLLSIQDH